MGSLEVMIIYKNEVTRAAWPKIWDIKSKNRSRTMSVAVFGGGSRIRTENTKPSRDPCYNDFYCVFLQMEFADSDCFWGTIGAF